MGEFLSSRFQSVNSSSPRRSMRNRCDTRTFSDQRDDRTSATHAQSSARQGRDGQVRPTHCSRGNAGAGKRLPPFGARAQGKLAACEPKPSGINAFTQENLARNIAASPARLTRRTTTTECRAQHGNRPSWPAAAWTLDGHGVAQRPPGPRIGGERVSGALPLGRRTVLEQISPKTYK